MLRRTDAPEHNRRLKQTDSSNTKRDQHTAYLLAIGFAFLDFIALLKEALSCPEL